MKPSGLHLKPALGIMARYPIEGKTKTRLSEGLGHQKATQFYQLCAQSIFQEMSQLPKEVSKYVFFLGDQCNLNIKDWTGNDYVIKTQIGDDLGQRLYNAFEGLFANKIDQVIIIASDIPDISAKDIIKATIALQTHDLILGPAQDGGYYLIGLSKLHPELFFNIHWGSDTVLKETLSVATSLELKSFLLTTLIDIDTIDNLSTWLSSSSIDSPLTRLVRSFNIQ